ncbi:MAG: thiamine ABC transporter substrate-binding protein [Neisseria sp.]|nr:thiamine ABC transporter substrate-binding protein [Neisseria sp.]
MKRWLCAAVAALLFGGVQAQTEVRLAVHKSFSLPKDAFEAFEKANDAKVSVIKAGSGNEMVNKLILSRAAPIADAVYGLDNTTILKAGQAGILAGDMVAVDFGYITLNYDKAWFAKQQLPLPKTLADLAEPQYRNLLAVPNPGMSTVGLGFLLANIEGLGEKAAFDWWAKMRANGVKVTKGWSEAYYTEFTQNGGTRPLVVSYATSPAAEVFYSKGKYSEPPTGNLHLKGGVFRQIEGAAVLKGAKQPVLAAKLAAYLRTPAVQKAVPSEMWVYPAVNGTPLPDAFRFVQPPAATYNPSEQLIAKHQKRWVSRWIRTVLK